MSALTSTKLPRVTLNASQQQNLELGVPFLLTTDQAHYLQRVLRMGLGDRFMAMDGQGKRWIASLAKPLEKNQTALLIEELLTTRELALQVHLAIGMPKGSGMENIIRQTTELGVHRITPLLCARSLLQPGEQKLQRWRRIAQEATELALRSVVPQIDAPVPFATILHNAQNTDRFMGVTHPETPHLITFARTYPQVTILTGPEGGWSPEEEAAAIDWGWQPVTLAPGVLSATTAPVIALAIVSANSYQL